MTFDPQLRRHLPPRKGRNHNLRLLQSLIETGPGGGAESGLRAGSGSGSGSGSGKPDPAMLANEIIRHNKRRAIVLLISDFAFPGYEELIRRLALATELRLIRLVHDQESQLRQLGMLRLFDSETGDYRLIDTRGTPNKPMAARALSNDFARCARRYAVPCCHFDLHETHMLTKLARLFSPSNAVGGRR